LLLSGLEAPCLDGLALHMVAVLRLCSRTK
jgi:hypothetical protein